MKVLISAYACEPDKGSEPEVGFRTMLAAARQHDVWVVTRENNVDSIKSALEERPDRDRVRVVGVDLPPSARQAKRRWGLAGLHWYYDRWQRQLSDVVVRLDHEFDFDVVHHVTFANYWTRCGAAILNKPLVWGPVGGGVDTPLPLAHLLGWRGLGRDGARLLLRSAAQATPWVRRCRRAAAVVLAQNPETSRRIAVAERRPPEILANALAVAAELPPQRGPRSCDVIFAGRLIPYKAAVLAVSAMRFIRHPHATLHIYGHGPEHDRIAAWVRRYGLSARVRLAGAIPRAALLEHIGLAGVVLHTALHDDSPLSMAEALALGTPVVYLSRGGPPVLADQWPNTLSYGVRPTTLNQTSRALAEGVDTLLGASPPVPTEVVQPQVDFGLAILDAYEAAVRHRSFE